MHDGWNPNPAIVMSLPTYRSSRPLHRPPMRSYPSTGPGIWLLTGHTIMKAVLSDAIALVCGDKFYTSSFSPSTLTT